MEHRRISFTSGLISIHPMPSVELPLASFICSPLALPEPPLIVVLDRQAKHMPLAPLFKSPLAALLSIPRRWPFTTSMEDIWKWSPLGKLLQLRLGVFEQTEHFG